MDLDSVNATFLFTVRNYSFFRLIQNFPTPKTLQRTEHTETYLLTVPLKKDPTHTSLPCFSLFHLKYVHTWHLRNPSKLKLSLSEEWYCKAALSITAQKIRFSIKNFFSKYDQFRWKLRIWSHLLKKSLMENFIFVQCIHFWSGKESYIIYGVGKNKSSKSPDSKMVKNIIT